MVSTPGWHRTSAASQGKGVDGLEYVEHLMVTNDAPGQGIRNALLALEVAPRMQTQFQDGASLVMLASGKRPERSLRHNCVDTRRLRHG
jgi:hypothetical protein